MLVRSRHALASAALSVTLCAACGNAQVAQAVMPNGGHIPDEKSEAPSRSGRAIALTR